MADSTPPSPRGGNSTPDGAYRKRLGDFAERRAEEYLQQCGYRVLQRNVHLRFAEIDLVALKDDMTVLVEVRARREGTLGSPLYSFSRAKLRHMRMAAEQFVALHPELPQAARIDVVAVTVSATGTVADIELVENAVQAEG